MGRPTIFTPELAAEILDHLSHGESLRAICREEGMPSRTTVADWVIRDVQGFASQYARARDMGLDEMADQAIDVARTPVEAERTKTGLLGLETTTGDAVDRSKLHVDTLKWYVSKLAPKRYGDRLEVEHKGTVDLAARIIDARKRTGG